MATTKNETNQGVLLLSIVAIGLLGFFIYQSMKPKTLALFPTKIFRYDFVWAFEVS